jgi:hypothetical protein
MPGAREAGPMVQMILARREEFMMSRQFIMGSGMPLPHSSMSLLHLVADKERAQVSTVEVLRHVASDDFLIDLE